MDYLFYFNLLKEAGDSKIVENLIPFLISWYLVKKEIKKQFSNIHESINNVANNLESFGVSLEKVQSGHNNRLLSLEDSLDRIKSNCLVCSNQKRGGVMDVAFSLKDLKDRLAEKGLTMLEDDIKFVLEVINGWVEDSIKLTPSKTDDIALPFLPFVKSLVESYVNKIDGK